LRQRLDLWVRVLAQARLHFRPALGHGNITARLERVVQSAQDVQLHLRIAALAQHANQTGEDLIAVASD
jgi:hypothetical protein